MADDAKKLRGTVKFFDEIKGFGFIVAEGIERDIFVHYDSIEGEGFRTLLKDDEVEFELIDEGKGPKADHVRRIEN
jgi:CspA family cold shock protein